MEAVKHRLRGFKMGVGAMREAAFSPANASRWLQDTLKRVLKFPNGSLFVFVESYLIFPSGSNPSNGGFWPGWKSPLGL